MGHDYSIFDNTNLMSKLEIAKIIKLAGKVVTNKLIFRDHNSINMLHIGLPETVLCFI